MIINSLGENVNKNLDFEHKANGNGEYDRDYFNDVYGQPGFGEQETHAKIQRGCAAVLMDTMMYIGGPPGSAKQV